MNKINSNIAEVDKNALDIDKNSIEGRIASMEITETSNNGDHIEKREFKTFKPMVSKTGRPCLWECGGMSDIRGLAICIADPNGEKKRAIFKINKGDIGCRNHALIPVEVNDLVCEVRIRLRNDKTSIRLYRLISVSKNEIVGVLLDDYESYSDLINTTIEKANTRDCLVAMYANSKQRNRKMKNLEDGADDTK